MKKNLLFAFAFVASAWAFTACNFDGQKSEPTPGMEIDPTAYILTQWRVDSVFESGVKSRVPHAYIDVISAKKAIINGDTATYSFDKEMLTINDQPYAIVKVDTGFAQLKDGALDIYLSQLPEFDMSTQIMEPKKADFVGTWKFGYFTHEYHASGEPTQYAIGTNPWVETWEFKADGKATYRNLLTEEVIQGEWDWNGGLKFVANPAEPVLGNDPYITVQPLTRNWMGTIRGDGNDTNQWFFVRIK